jgi:hypothetical protein
MSTGFTGKDCSFEINECHSMPCMNNGFCVDLQVLHFATSFGITTFSILELNVTEYTILSIMLC